MDIVLNIAIYIRYSCYTEDIEVHSDSTNKANNLAKRSNKKYLCLISK